MSDALARLWRSTTAVSLVFVALSAVVIRADQPAPEEIRAIAQDAYIYGLPLVENYRLMYASAVDRGGDQYKAPFNTLTNLARVFTPDDTSIVTPNVETPLSVMCMDLRTEPLVLGVPAIDSNRYYAIYFADLYGFILAYIGTRATSNVPGFYMVAGPDWQGETPAGVVATIPSDTDFAFAIYRTQLRGTGDLDAIVSIQNNYTVQTLSSFLGRPAPQPAPAVQFPKPAPELETGPAFFDYLNFALQFCRINPSETNLMARFAAIGIVPGQPFGAARFSAEAVTALTNGIADAQAAIASSMVSADSVELFATRTYAREDYLKRAVAVRTARRSDVREEVLKPLYVVDAEGAPLDASTNNYVLNLSGGNMPPVDGFWSITVYDSATQTIVSNPINRYQISSTMLTNLVRGPENSLSLYIQHEPPAQDKVANWLPAPDGPFYMVMRLYWPKPEALDGTWTPPPVWREQKTVEQAVLIPSGTEQVQAVKPIALVEEAQPGLERPTTWGEPTEVRVGIYVIDVDEIDSAQQSFAASVYYEVRWNNPFLRHKGPSPMLRQIGEIWNPRVTIISEQMAWRAFPESVEIQPDGEAVYRQKVWGRFSQPLELRNFPLDRQILSIHIVAAGLSEEHVKMVSLARDGRESSGIAPSFSLPDFDVLSWKAEPAAYYPRAEGPGVAGFRMQIEVGRRTHYFILKVIIPLCLIVIMSWLPRWIDPEQTGVNVGISTTAFLTLVAYLFAITVLLPRVSYITRMDRFILLSTLMVFGALMQSVGNTALIRHKKKALVERIDRWSRVVYPLLLIAVLAYSFVL
jgi:hypothetical protein